jgi:hypothetical protein
MQERTGRVLKLVSGSVILALGVILIAFPDLLNWTVRAGDHGG